MAVELDRRGANWTMNHAVGDVARLPLRSELKALGYRATINSPDRVGRLGLEQFLVEPRPGASVYSCGPIRFIDAVELAGHAQPNKSPPERTTVRATRSKVDDNVSSGMTMLNALAAARVAIPSPSCVRGVCGSCALRVIDGIPEHCHS
jgi:ferredoxin